MSLIGLKFQFICTWFAFSAAATTKLPLWTPKNPTLIPRLYFSNSNYYSCGFYFPSITFFKGFCKKNKNYILLGLGSYIFTYSSVTDMQLFKAPHYFLASPTHVMDKLWLFVTLLGTFVSGSLPRRSPVLDSLFGYGY